MWGFLQYYYNCVLPTRVHKINLASAVNPKKKEKTKREMNVLSLICPPHGSDSDFMRLPLFSAIILTILALRALVLSLQASV